MKTWTLLTAGAVVFALTATPVFAQTGGRADIEQVQKALKQQGHDPGQIDGVLGPQTSAALSAYQKAQGLNTTGRLDPATMAKLGSPSKAAESEARQNPSASPSGSPSGTPRTGGDTKPNAVDPAQSKKTGANVGEGASYNRSNEKGLSTTEKGADKDK
jgi:peptidoglycan hydrolase-like protein with peptidoglycan-binding domain